MDYITLKFRILWNVAPCKTLKWTEVSEVRTASIIRAMNKPRAKGYQVIQESVVQVKIGPRNVQRSVQIHTTVYTVAKLTCAFR
jgi:hypothetical protein